MNKSRSWEVSLKHGVLFIEKRRVHGEAEGRMGNHTDNAA